MIKITNDKIAIFVKKNATIFSLSFFNILPKRYNKKTPNNDDKHIKKETPLKIKQ